MRTKEEIMNSSHSTNHGYSGVTFNEMSEYERRQLENAHEKLEVLCDIRDAILFHGWVSSRGITMDGYRKFMNAFLTDLHSPIGKTGKKEESDG